MAKTRKMNFQQARGTHFVVVVEYLGQSWERNKIMETMNRFRTFLKRKKKRETSLVGEKMYPASLGQGVLWHVQRLGDGYNAK